MDFQWVIIDLIFLKIMDYNGLFSITWSQSVILIDYDGDFLTTKNDYDRLISMEPHCGLLSRSEPSISH